MEKEIILEAFRKAGIATEEKAEQSDNDTITKLDLYECGLSGGINSSAMRKKLLAKLKLPELLTASGMVSVLNTMMSRQDFFELAEKLNSGEEQS